MMMWKYASTVVRMFLSIHAKFVDNALYKARRYRGLSQVICDYFLLNGCFLTCCLRVPD